VDSDPLKFENDLHVADHAPAEPVKAPDEQAVELAPVGGLEHGS